MNGAPAGGGRFPTTRWTLILSAREDGEARRAALEELLAAYWRPLYFYARRKGMRPEEAEDAVQGFCVHVLEKDVLGRSETSGPDVVLEEATPYGRGRASFESELVPERPGPHWSRAAEQETGGYSNQP